jgi:hypothetical protein
VRGLLRVPILYETAPIRRQREYDLRHFLVRSRSLNSQISDILFFQPISRPEWCRAKVCESAKDKKIQAGGDDNMAFATLGKRTYCWDPRSPKYADKDSPSRFGMCLAK